MRWWMTAMLGYPLSSLGRRVADVPSQEVRWGCVGTWRSPAAQTVVPLGARLGLVTPAAKQICASAAFEWSLFISWGRFWLVSRSAVFRFVKNVWHLCRSISRWRSAVTVFGSRPAFLPHSSASTAAGKYRAIILQFRFSGCCLCCCGLFDSKSLQLKKWLYSWG